MQAMVLEKPGSPLVLKNVPTPRPGKGQVLVKILACGVCRTDLHIVDGELSSPKLPLIPGHEVIGTVIETGRDTTLLKPGNTVGISWLGYACGRCRYCLKGKENLCQESLFTGYTLDGGYAEYMTASEQFCFPIREDQANISGAPLLCAGLIGYRSYSMTGPDVTHLGIYGFGAAAHILIQLAIAQGRKVYAFTREGDRETQLFALSLGACWAGDSSQAPPVKLDAAIIFAPAGDLVPAALKHTDKGGIVVCGGIHMSDIPSFPYNILWGERTLRSVANLTRTDGHEFLRLATETGIRTHPQVFPLHLANEALQYLRAGKINGAAVLTPF